MGAAIILFKYLFVFVLFLLAIATTFALSIFACMALGKSYVENFNIGHRVLLILIGCPVCVVIITGAFDLIDLLLG